MMLYVLSVLSAHPNAHIPSWFGKLRWRGSGVSGVEGSRGELEGG